MILRTWKARTTRELEPSYLERVQALVLPYLRSVPGFRGAGFARRELEDELEILVITCWESMEAARRFSGAPGERAYMPPEISETLSSYDETSEHFETLITEGPALSG